ncbi:MAG: hypothetical protein O9301_05435 [Leptospira sp.]|nr:hypothetical protein [Leptospira sp.]
MNKNVKDLTYKKYPILMGIFIVAAIWNLIGAGFGYFNTAYTFQNLFHRELVDPLYYHIYQGAWGTTLTYFIGYLIVAYNPMKHTGIVIVGGIGKLGFALKLLQFYLSGFAQPIVFVVIVGDLIFCAVFIYYFMVLKFHKETIL